MEYAVVEIGGKQYKVVAGDTLVVDRLKQDKGDLKFDKVLLHVVDSVIDLGAPYLTNVVVTGKLLEDVKGEKLRVSRFTAKSRHRRTIGFRASQSKIQINGIVKTSSKVKEEAKKDAKPKK